MLEALVDSTQELSHPKYKCEIFMQPALDPSKHLTNMILRVPIISIVLKVLALLSNVKTLRTIESNFCGLLRKPELQE